MKRGALLIGSILSFLSLTFLSIIFLSSIVSANPSYIPDPFTGEIIAIMHDDGKLYFPVYDITEYKLYDEGGNLVYSQKYTPFGEILSSFGTNPLYWSPQGFQDPDTDINMDIAVSTLDAVLAESADPPYDTSTAKFLQDWGTIAVKDAPKNIALCMRGMKEGVYNTIAGTCYTIAHPFQTAEAIGGIAGSLYYQPEETLSGYGNAALTAIKEGWDDPRFLGRRSVDVFGFLSGTRLMKGNVASPTGRYGLPKGFEWGGVSGGQKVITDPARLLPSPAALPPERVFFIDPQGIAIVGKRVPTRSTFDLGATSLSRPRELLPLPTDVSRITNLLRYSIKEGSSVTRFENQLEKISSVKPLTLAEVEEVYQMLEPFIRANEYELRGLQMGSGFVSGKPHFQIKSAHIFIQDPVPYNIIDDYVRGPPILRRYYFNIFE